MPYLDIIFDMVLSIIEEYVIHVAIVEKFLINLGICKKKLLKI